METIAALFTVVKLIATALRDGEKLPAALLASGIVEAAAALALAVFKPAGGIFLHHGRAPLYLYYGILVAVVIFGFLEASAGFWVAGELTKRRAVGKTILWVSLLPLVLVVGLGGFVILK